MAKIAVEVKAAAVARLEELRADGVLTAAHVRTVAPQCRGERADGVAVAVPAGRQAREDSRGTTTC
ncbi:hypothetical protein [Streptomyces sp. NPDC048196]|uniref:hypothetical protein n=1 Tax=Streptomyces sp. NPDC048196 TaxID=3154712 RepID=UPI0033EC26BF